MAGFVAQVTECIFSDCSNYCIVYPPFPSARFMVPRAEKKLNAIARELLCKSKKDIPKPSKMIRRQFDKMMKKYLSVQEYADLPFFSTENCISCGLCEKICPCNNIKLKDGKPKFQGHCTQCMACISFCPKRAIGYQLTDEHRKLLKSYDKGMFFVRIMGFPKNRKPYTNPYIKAADLIRQSKKYN